MPGDTPDYQVGVVSAQAVLANVNGGTGTVTVTVPANVETIAVLWESFPAGVAFACTGVTSGLNYPGATLQAPGGGGVSFTTYFDVTNAVDAQVTIASSTVPTQPWHVYADNAVHVVTDPALNLSAAPVGGATPSGALLVGGTDGTHLQALSTDRHGREYVIPSAPSLIGTDHPAVEVQYGSVGGIAATTVVLAAPGAGIRYRLFFVHAWAENAAASYYVLAINPSGGNTFFCVSEIPAGAPAQVAELPLTGFATEANTGVSVGVIAGQCGVTLGWTVENV